MLLTGMLTAELESNQIENTDNWCTTATGTSTTSIADIIDDSRGMWPTRSCHVEQSSYHTNGDRNIRPPLIRVLQFACSPLIQLSPNFIYAT